MGKFKVGDKVTVRRDLSESMENVDKGMLRYAGRRAEVVRDNGTDWMQYDLDIDDRKWGWGDEMLEPAGFAREDLKPCMVVVTRDGSIAIVAMSRDYGMVLNFKDGSWTNLKDYSDGLESATREENDITEVYGLSGLSFKANEISTDNRELLWKREEPKPKRKMTVSEICEALGEEIEIVKGENS